MVVEHDDHLDRAFRGLVAPLFYLTVEMGSAEIAALSDQALATWPDSAHRLASEVAGVLAEAQHRARTQRRRAPGGDPRGDGGNVTDRCPMATAHAQLAPDLDTPSEYPPEEPGGRGRRTASGLSSRTRTASGSAAARRRPRGRGGRPRSTPWAVVPWQPLRRRRPPLGRGPMPSVGHGGGRPLRRGVRRRVDGPGLPLYGLMLSVRAQERRDAGRHGGGPPLGLPRRCAGSAGMGYQHEQATTVAAALPLIAGAGRTPVAAALLAGLRASGALVERLHAPLLDRVESTLHDVPESAALRGSTMGMTELLDVAQHTLRELLDGPATSSLVPEGEAGGAPALVRTGELWRLTYEGRSVHWPAMARACRPRPALLRSPGRDVGPRPRRACRVQGRSVAGRATSASGSTPRRGPLTRSASGCCRRTWTTPTPRVTRGVRDGWRERSSDPDRGDWHRRVGLHGPRRTGDPAERARAGRVPRASAAPCPGSPQSTPRRARTSTARSSPAGSAPTAPGPRRAGASRSERRSASEPGHRVDDGAVLADLEVQVRPGGVAGRRRRCRSGRPCARPGPRRTRKRAWWA